MSRRIFISYDREDSALVESLAQSLRDDDRHEVFYDAAFKREAGAPWWERLLDEIERCDLFVSVLSPDQATSTPCKLESEYAHALARTLLCVYNRTVSPAMYPRWIAEAQWLRFDPSSAADVVPVMSAARNLLPSPALPNPMPDRPEVPISYLDGLMAKVTAPAGELSAAEQWQIWGELNSRLAGDDRDSVLTVVRMLRGRIDVSNQVATAIDTTLGPTPMPPRSPTQDGSRSPIPPAVAPPWQPSQTQPPPPHGTATVGSQPTPSTAKPNNYLGWAIAATVLTCLIPGVVALIYSLIVDPRWSAGDAAGARKAAGLAKTWTIVSFCVVGLWLIIGLAGAAVGTDTSGGSGF
jgi:Interferon-induced transmembrane protein/TIR domain